MDWRTPAQQAYQKNMFRSLVIVTLLCAIVTVFIGRLKTQTERIGDGGICGGPVTGDTLAGPADGGVIFGGIGAWLPSSAPLGGFLGFHVRIVPDDRQITSAIEYSPNYQTDYLPPEDVEDDAPPIGYGPGTGRAGDGWSTSGAGSEMWSEAPERPVVNRDVEVVRVVEPEYPQVAKMSGKEGLVTIMVHIDDAGRRSAFSYHVIADDGAQRLEFYTDGSPSDSLETIVMREEPSGWYFAEKVLDAIEHWEFSPAVDQGVPRASFLEITYHFCLGMGCGTLRLRSIDQHGE